MDQYVELHEEDATTSIKQTSSSTKNKPTSTNIQQDSFCCSLIDTNTKKLVQMLLLFCCVILVGGFVFQFIEEPNELVRVKTLRSDHTAAKARILGILNNNQSLVDLLVQNGANQAFDTAPNYTNQWSFASSCLVSSKKLELPYILFHRIILFFLTLILSFFFSLTFSCI